MGIPNKYGGTTNDFKSKLKKRKEGNYYCTFCGKKLEKQKGKNFILCSACDYEGEVEIKED